MDDTAFHYSRTLRIIMVLAIVIPILVICAILWHFGAFDGQVAPAGDETPAASVETQR
jgi:hypothetical protein